MLVEERQRELRWFTLRDVTAICNCLVGRDTEKMATPTNRQNLHQGPIKH